MLRHVVMAICVIFGLKLAWNTVAIGLSFAYLHSQNKPHLQSGSAVRSKIFIIVPLLREQARLSPLLDRFSELVKRYSFLQLVLVTSERELVEKKFQDASMTTQELITASEVFRSLPAGRKHHFHFPFNNHLISEQLNFALSKLLEAKLATNSDYILLYNADSLIDFSTINEMAELVKRGVLIAQQSSLFLKNIEGLLLKREYVAAGDAIFQSRWTLEREIPRYLIGSGMVSFIPSVVSKNWFAHCVGHGLLIQISVLDRIGGFPMPVVGLEDSATGFKLRALGLKITPIPVLENGDAAETVGSLVRQKSNWVRGPIGSVEYLVNTWTSGNSKVRCIWLMLQGMYSGLKWAFGSIALTFALAASIYTGQWPIFCLLYGIYCWLPFFITLLVWRLLPREIFPRIPVIKLAPVCIVYPAIPMLHGFSGLYGIMRIARQLLFHDRFRQAKTETLLF